MKQQANLVIKEFISEEMNERSERLIEVGFQMMLSQGVEGVGGQQGQDWVKKQLDSVMTELTFVFVRDIQFR